MRFTRPLIVITPLLMAACTAQSADNAETQIAAAPTTPVHVRDAMQDDVNPAIMAIWEVTNNVYTDAGEQDPGLITEAQWLSLAENAGKLAATGDAMALAQEIRAASPGNMVTGEYEVSMEAVQGFIDADPAGFRAMSASFAVLARNLESAANARDGNTALDLVGQMDTECAACHAQFWYAEAE